MYNYRIIFQQTSRYTLLSHSYQSCMTYLHDISYSSNNYVSQSLWISPSFWNCSTFHLYRTYHNRVFHTFSSNSRILPDSVSFETKTRGRASKKKNFFKNNDKYHHETHSIQSDVSATPSCLTFKEKKQLGGKCFFSEPTKEKHDLFEKNISHTENVTQRWRTNDITPHTTILRAYEAPDIPTLHDPIVIRRPGEIVDIATVIRNYWAMPLTGFNSILEVPVYPFEIMENQKQRCLKVLVLPSDIFGIIIRPDLIFRAWRFYVKAYTGWTERMMLFKTEIAKGKGNIRFKRSSTRIKGWRKAPGKYPGVHVSPKARPKDRRQKLNKKVLFSAFKMTLAAKFAQDQIRVVEHFNLNSHKTKYCVTHFQRLIGTRSRRVLVVHCDGKGDINDNFRWACAHISGIERHTPDTLSIYNLIKNTTVIFSRIALLSVIDHIQQYPEKQKWGPRYATPDGQPAPIPQPVPGWNNVWLKKKRCEKLMDYKYILEKMQRHWAWSSYPKGPMKVWKDDPLKNFRLKEWHLNEPDAPWDKWEMFNTVNSNHENDKMNHLTTNTAIMKMITPTPIHSNNSSLLENQDEEMFGSRLITKDDIIKLRLKQN